MLDYTKEVDVARFRTFEKTVARAQRAFSAAFSIYRKTVAAALSILKNYVPPRRTV